MATLEFVMKNNTKTKNREKDEAVDYRPPGTHLQTLMLQGNIKISMIQTHNAYRNFGLCM
jgi:hypothetical protein